MNGEVPAKSTPKKIYIRSSSCRLCGGGNESHHMLRVLSKTGLEKNLPSKLHYACGIIAINNSDCFTKLICRKSEAFIHKVWDFKQKCQDMQTKLELEQYCLVKGCMELSPSCKQPAKRSAGKSRGEASAKQRLFGETSTEASKSDQQELVEKADPSSIVNNAEELSTPLRDSQHQDDHENNLGAIISRALNSKPADIMAEIIRTHCPSVFLVLKSAIAAEVY